MPIDKLFQSLKDYLLNSYNLVRLACDNLKIIRDNSRNIVSDILTRIGTFNLSDEQAASKRQKKKQLILESILESTSGHLNKRLNNCIG